MNLQEETPTLLTEDNTAVKVDKLSPSKTPQFIPKFLGKKVTVRPLTGQPVTGTLEGYNSYELRILVGGKKEIIVFKHAIYTIEVAP